MISSSPNELDLLPRAIALLILKITALNRSVKWLQKLLAIDVNEEEGLISCQFSNTVSEVLLVLDS